MRTPVKLAAFVGAIALTFGAGLGLGAAVGPLTTTVPTHSVDPSAPEHGTPGHSTTEPETSPVPVTTTGPAGDHDETEGH